jgi:acetoin utilization protein AcuB
VKIPDIQSVMTAFPRSIDADATVSDAQSMMAQHGVRHLPVTNGNTVVGIVTDRDVRLALDPLLHMPTLQMVRGMMTPEPYVVGPDEPLDRVLITMAERRIGCAVVAEDGKLTGIFTTTDAARMLGEHFRSMRPEGGEKSG